jgi:hypothetical protein
LVRAVAVVVLYLAGLNAVLLTFARGCTPLAVESLITGGSISIVLYALALLPLIGNPIPRRNWVWVAPALLPVAYLAWWTGHLALGLWLGGRSACELLTGTDGLEAQGREGQIVLIYLAVTLGAAAGMALSWWRAPRGGRSGGSAATPFDLKPQ